MLRDCKTLSMLVLVAQQIKTYCGSACAARGSTPMNGRSASTNFWTLSSSQCGRPHTDATRLVSSSKRAWSRGASQKLSDEGTLVGDIVPSIDVIRKAVTEEGSFPRPRRVAMYLAKRLTRLSLSQIGRGFDGNSSTVVAVAVLATERDMEADPVFAAKIARLKTQITTSSKKSPKVKASKKNA